MTRALTCNAVAVRACGSRTSIVVACDAAAEGADLLLLAALDALKGRDAERARKLHAEAAEAYDAAGGPSAEQADLLALVGSRVDQAVVPGFGRTAQRPPTPTKQELAARTRAKMEGDTVLMGSVQAFSNKTDSARFGTSYALLDEARDCYRRAGSDVERERDAVMGSTRRELECHCDPTPACLRPDHCRTAGLICFSGNLFRQPVCGDSGGGGACTTSLQAR